LGRLKVPFNDPSINSASEPPALDVARVRTTDG